MRTEEDEAFDDLAKRQGDWGSGFQAKRQMAADKQREWAGLTNEAKAVIAAAKAAMNASFETENKELDISIPAHLAAALSLRLDELEAAQNIGEMK